MLVTLIHYYNEKMELTPTVEPLSKADIIGEIKSVLYKEVSFIQWFVNYDIFNLSHNSYRIEINSTH